jgi:hypothetical protein
MSSGAFAPLGATAGLTHDAGRTSFSPDPLSAACLNAYRLEFALGRRDRDRAPEAFYHPFAYACATSDGVL